nr:immunoglobulin heavy chain junction region [Mus musculus]
EDTGIYYCTDPT